MNRSKAFKFALILSGTMALCLILGSMVFVQVKGQDDLGALCTISGGLKFCAQSLEVVSNETRREVILNLSLTNVGGQSTAINRGEAVHTVVLKNAKGETLLTKREQKLKDNATGEELQDLIASSFVSRRPDDVEIGPGETLNEKIKLSEIYDLISAGKYVVDVARKIKSPTGEEFIVLQLENIELEVR